MRQAGPTPPLRILAGLAAAGLVAVLALGGRTAGAGEPKPPMPKPTGNVTFAAKAEPERVAPGGQGVVVIVGTIKKDVHVFSDKRFKVKPYPFAGVTYGTPERSKHVVWVDPELPDEPGSEVWFDRVEVRLPYTVGPDAAFPLTVGAILTWSACDPEQCYGAESTLEPIVAEVQKDGAGASPPPDSPHPTGTTEIPMPAPGPAVAAPMPPTAAPAGGAPTSSPAKFEVQTVVKAADGAISVRATEREVVATFEPLAGLHMYAVGHVGVELPVNLAGVETGGVSWGALVAPAVEDTEIHERYELHLPYTDVRPEGGDLEVAISWHACTDQGGTCHTPEGPHHFRVHREGGRGDVQEVPAAGAPPAPAPVARTGPAAPAPAPAIARAGGPLPEHGLLFPVIGTSEESMVDALWRRLGILILGPLFLAGVLLAFTPCVLPIIPITVSIIGGGRTDLTRSRLVLLLACYVLGLSLAFGTMGVIAAKAGGSFAAAFQSPVALWAIAGVFVVLAFGMLGLYELQLPASLQRLQGGAKGGSVLGAFILGAIAALIASPCTGPFIAALVVFTAQSGNVLLGFLLFAAMGLGMGSVFFVAGSLNLLAKPGPWMVWVRYGFGVMLIGIALYYLASSGKLGSIGVFATGFGLAALAAFGIARHLVKKEGEATGPAATRGAQVAILLVLATGLVAFVTRPPAPWTGKAGEGPVTWVNVESREALVAEVEKAVREGKATVVDVWATWCANCRKYDHVIEESPQVKSGFQALHRVRIDLTEGPPSESGLREGLGIPGNTQPFLVFLDAQGRIRRELDVKKWHSDESATELTKRLEGLKKAP